MNRDRGQIILIAAFALAVIFVALAVITNSAIYTENLASRGETSGSSEALQMRYEVEQGLGEVMTNVNEYNNSDHDAAMQTGIEDTERIVAMRASTDSRNVEIENVGSNVQGTRIFDNSTGGSTFVDDSGNADWTVVSTVEVRQFHADFQSSTITSADDLDDGNDWTDEFIINVTSGGDTWQIHIGEDSSNTDTLRVIDGDKDSGFSSVGDCDLSTPENNVSVDFSEGTAAGEPCEPLDDIWEDVGSSYNVHYSHGGDVDGNYTMTVDDGSIGTVDNRDNADPSKLDAIYSTTVRYRFDTPSLTYETDVRVAPGEADD